MTAVLVAVAGIIAVTVLKHRTKTASAKRDAERVRMEADLAEARAREDAAILERAQLEASLHATREAAEAQPAALQQLSSELGDRLLQQQATAFQATTAALERRASSESEAIRAAYEAATAVLFVPADGVLDAALRRDPHLLHHAASRAVHLVTPTTLPLVLSAIEQLWRQDGRDRRADEVEQLGTALLERLGVVLGHVSRLQRHVNETVAAYNALTASLESRLLPVARRLESLGVRSRESRPGIGEIDTLPRELGPRLEGALVPIAAASPSDELAPPDTRAAA